MKKAWRWEVTIDDKEPCGTQCEICGKIVRDGDVILRKKEVSKRHWNKDTWTENFSFRYTVMHKRCLEYMFEDSPQGHSVYDTFENIKQSIMEGKVF